MLRVVREDLSRGTSERRAEGGERQAKGTAVAKACRQKPTSDAGGAEQRPARRGERAGRQAGAGAGKEVGSVLGVTGKQGPDTGHFWEQI